MSLNLPVGGTLKLRAVYVDASGNPTAAPANAGPITWTLSDPTVATLDTETGAEVVLTATGALAATETVSVSDGTFTSPTDTVTITAGPAVGIQIVAE